jgi:hypothetical protein
MEIEVVLGLKGKLGTLHHEGIYQVWEAPLILELDTR